MNQADSTDGQIDQKFNANQEAYGLISKTKAELSGMMPQTASQQELANAPIVVQLKKCLDDLDAIIEERRKMNDEAVQKL